MKNRLGSRLRIFLFLLSVIILLQTLLWPIPTSAEPSGQTFHFFQAIPQDGDATVADWARLGVPTKTADALVAYQKNPSMATAIGVLQHYNTFAKDNDMRRACFAHNETLFQTLDAAKYELIVKTQQRLPGLDHSFRVGSTGARFKAWIDWKLNGGTLDDMPKLDPNKQFKSDDDVTNVAGKAARKANPLASELINGETARDEFKKMTKELFGVELDPKTAMQVEFLSPTNAYRILHAKRPGEYVATWPGFMQAWVSADPEKYNGQWGEEQLHEWGLKAGYVTENVDDPTGSSKSYAQFNADNPERGFPKFPPDDLFGWVANNHRQIFQVHGGDLKSLAKYMLRETDAWTKLKLQIPEFDVPGKGKMSVADLEVMAEMIYKPETEAQVQHVKNIAPTAETILRSYLNQLLVEAHRQNVQMLVEKLKAIPPPRPPPGSDAPADPTAYLKSAQDDPEIQRILNNIAVGYTNLDDDTIKQIELEIDKDIDLGAPGDLSKDVQWDDAFRSRFAGHLKSMMEGVRGAAQVTKTDIEAFRFLRYSVGEEINSHLTNIAGKNLDDYLVQAAMGDVTESQVRWMGGRPRQVERVLTPEEIADDIRFMKSMAEEFNYGDKKFAKMVDEYFKGDPPAALKMLKLLHQIYDPTKMRPVAFKYKDADGNEVVKQIQPGRWDSVRSLGIVMFKGALKGWKIWGDLASGRDLFQNMYKIYGDYASATAEELAAAQCKALSSFIGVVEYVELVNLYGRSTITANIPLGGTLGHAAQLADGGYMEPQAQKDLALSLIKDITCMYIPHLAVANAVWGIASWGYDKWALSGAESDFINLLVENGKWKMETVTVKDKDGNERKVTDRTKLPELEEVKYTKDGETITETVPTHKIKKGGKEVTTCWRLAKLLNPPDGKQKYPDGIMLIKSKKIIDPRESLMEVAYRSGQGYIAKHQVLSITEKAIRELIDDKWFSFKLYWTSTRSWTADWLKSEMGVTVPTPEDARTIVRKKVEVENTIVDWWGFGSPVNYDWNAWISDGVRKNFGYLVSDYWVRRQRILEDDIIPILVEQAARRVMKDDIDNDASSYLDEIDQMDKRMMDLDDRVWQKIERSADPFKVTRDRDKEKDIPITEKFREETREERNAIKNMVKWLDNTDPAKDLYLHSESIMTSDGLVPVFEKLDEDGVKDKAKQLINRMTDLMYKYEEAYDKMIKKMQGINGYVAQSEGNPGFSTDAHHIPLRPARGRNADTKLVDQWDKGYREEYARVEQDVGNTLNVRGWDKVKGFERFMGDWTGTGFEFYAAKSHPYWGKLLRLRFQIRKLQIVQRNMKEVTKDEILRVFKNGRMLLEDKPIDPNNPPTSLSKEDEAPVTGVSLPPAGGSASSTATAPSAAPKSSESPLGIGTPADRDRFIKKMIALMEEEYQRLMARILNMFEMEVELKPVSPATDFAVVTVMEAKVSHKAKKGQIEQNKIKDVVQKYKWQIYRRNQTKYIERESKTPSIKLPLLEGSEVKTKDPVTGADTTKGGAMLLIVQALGEHDIPLAQATQAFPVKPAKFSGKLKIWGTWPGHAPIMILADGQLVDTLQPGAGTDLDETFHFKVRKSPRIRNMDLKDLDNKFYVDFKAMAEVGIAPKARSKFKTGKLYPAEFWLNPDDPLELFYPYRVTIEVDTTDASGAKVTENIEIKASGPQNSQTQPPYILLLHKDDKATVTAKHIKDPVCEKTVHSGKFDPADGTVMDFDIRLPYYEKGNLTVQGKWVPKADINPPAVISGGIMSSDLNADAPVNAGGTFSFTNDIPWLQLKKFKVQAAMWTDDDRVFRPRGGGVTAGFDKPVLAKIFNMGEIEVEQATVKVDPIIIRVLDLVGRELPTDKIEVMIGDKKAALDGKQFKGAWTFKKRKEKVKITATLDRSAWGGKSVQGFIEYRVDDKAFFTGRVVPPTPFEIRLDVLYPLSISLTNTVETPQNKNPPLKVKIDSITVEGMSPAPSPSFVEANDTKYVLINAPVGKGQPLTLKARAKADGVEYTGSASAAVPTKPAKFEMTVVLKPKKKTQKLISISNLTVSGPGGSKPKSGKGMSASAQINVGDIDVPQLSVEWRRMSDGHGAGDLGVETVKGKNTALPVSKTFPPLPDGNNVKQDQIKLTVTDGASPPTGDTKIVDFEWESADRFISMGLAPPSDNAGKFKKGTPIAASSEWELAEGLGDTRTVIYAASGSELARETVTVTGKNTLSHSTSLPTDQLSAGQVAIKVKLIGSDPTEGASGEKVIRIEEDKDQILKAAAVVAAGDDEIINPDEQVNIWAKVQAAKGKDGNRTLTTRFRGQRPTVSFPLQGGQTSNQALVISTAGLRPSRYQTRIYLIDEEGKRQANRVVRFYVREKRAAGDSGLQDVVCSQGRITLKFWDHAAQDDDISVISIGKNWTKTVNLNACGGPDEPAGGPCVQTNLKLPKGQSATISVTAVDEGKYKPNTAALKVIGGCNPTEQHWSLKAGKSASIRIMRGNPKKRTKR